MAGLIALVALVAASIAITYDLNAIGLFLAGITVGRSVARATR
jgi:hypothetical protein